MQITVSNVAIGTCCLPSSTDRRRRNSVGMSSPTHVVITLLLLDDRIVIHKPAIRTREMFVIMGVDLAYSPTLPLLWIDLELEGSIASPPTN